MDEPLAPPAPAAAAVETELATPIDGKVVTSTAVMPSAAAVRADAKGRVGNTVQQVGVPGSLVIIGSWLAQLGNLDLDPTGPGRDMPAIVTTAFVVLLTWAMARWMNREGLAAGEDVAEVVDLRQRVAELEARLAA